LYHHHPLVRPFFALATFLLLHLSVYAQSPGLIVRPAGGPGAVVLNPDQNSWTSATTAGFTTSDITQSEIGYKIIKPITAEPSADLATGPDNGYSDIVKTTDGSGCYMFNNGSNFLFRFRIGGIVNGAKAYNILIDTDMKLGATGSSADPNYVAPTNSGNGNPGFEIEIAFQTGSNISIYNVDGIINPSASYTYSLATNSIISVALSRDNSNADYFYDFYVPLSALNALGLSSSTPFRIVTTTNTNPGSAFQGTRSDIYGINDELFPNTTDAWEYVGKNTPSVTLDDITSGGGGYPDICTAPPVVTTGIAAGSNVSVTGTWTRLDAAKPAAATITVYKNGISQGTTTCNTGGSWSFTVATLVSGDVITAKAQSTGESMCMVSNSVAVTTCAPANISSSSSFVLTCLSNRGAGGTRPDGARIKIYTIAYNGSLTLFADDATTTYKTLYNGTANPVGTTVWEYQHSSNGGTADPCGGGAPDMPTTNSYAFTITESGKCESAPIWPATCLIGTTTATPTITQTVFYAGTNTVSGNSTDAAASTVRLLVNGFIVASVNVAANGAYSFSNVVLQTGDVVTVRAQASAKCISNAATVTTTCFTTVPVINTDAQGNLVTGATTVSGTSTEATGTTIRVYAAPSTLIGTTTVQAGGSWSVTVSALTGGSSYYATAQNGSCGVSSNSTSATARSQTTVCPTITGSYAAGAGTVSGTFASSFTGTVYLYQDGAELGSAAVTASTNWTITLSVSNPLYAGGVLTAGAQATGSTLNKTCGTTTTVTCTAPAVPVISPSSTTIAAGQTVTYTITATESGSLYSIQNAGDGTSYTASGFGNGSDQTFTTIVFNTPGVYSVSVLADKLSGSACVSSAAATITVSGILPLSWKSFTAREQHKQVLLNWVTSNETGTAFFTVQHSPDGRSWSAIGTVAAAGNADQERAYSFVHTDPLPGTNFYRLVQTDLDARTSFSKVLTVITGADAMLITYPNPVTNGILTVQTAAPVVLYVYDNSGKLVQQQQAIAGTQQLDLSRLAKGIYFLKAGAATQKIFIK